MKPKTEEALETYINGNISDARKYFKRRKEELLAAADTLTREESSRFLRLMLEV